MSNIISITKMGFPWATQDPFLFCAHHRDLYPKGNESLGPHSSQLEGRQLGEDFTIKDGFRMYHGRTIPGFPYHPHRGFETITIAKEGTIDHSDSLGARGRFSNGDVQWMTAGKGVQHSEMFPLLHQDKENPLEIFQIWLNLPAKNKMVEPHFSMLWAETIPVITETDESNKTTVITAIAGNYKNATPPQPAPNSWAMDAENEVAVWTLHLQAGAKYTLPASSGNIRRTIYFYSGKTLQVENTPIENYHAVELISNTETSLQAGDEDCFVLMLQGKPINEPVAQYGPFVMNTQTEIQQAFADYQRTQFGKWPWPNADQVHGASQGRFAEYANGTIETP